MLKSFLECDFLVLSVFDLTTTPVSCRALSEHEQLWLIWHDKFLIFVEFVHTVTNIEVEFD